MNVEEDLIQAVPVSLVQQGYEVFLLPMEVRDHLLSLVERVSL
jgi:hypothetical protein